MADDTARKDDAEYPPRDSAQDTTPLTGQPTDETGQRRWRGISGPGAADFIAATGGLDLPENDPFKGTGTTNDEGVVSRSSLRPELDDPSPTTEREIRKPEDR